MGRILPRKVNSICFVAGLLAVLFMGLPYLLLGEDAIVTYHDQLDGELIAYLLQAKHLFQGNTLPEFLNGVSKTALIPPAPACVLLFLGGNGFAGLVCMQLLGSLCGYLGMYLLVKEAACGAPDDRVLFAKLDKRSGLKECNGAQDVNGEAADRKMVDGKMVARKNVNREMVDGKSSCLPGMMLSVIAMVVGVFYAYLPFLPVYGLAQYGLPMLVWCLLQAKKGRFVKTAFVYAALYALNSSLVLVGFGVLGSMLLWLLWLSWRSLCIEKNGHGAWKMHRSKEKTHNRTAENALNVNESEKGVIGANRKMLGNVKVIAGIWVTMLLLYIVENISLLKQTLGIGAADEISHKAEYVLTPSGFFRGFWQGLIKGGQHSEDYHYLFLIGIVVVMLLALWCKVGKGLVSCIGVCLGWNVFYALVAAVWDSGLGIALRTKLSALGAFQMNRLLWIAPCFWYLALGCGLALAVELVRKGGGRVVLRKRTCGKAGGLSETSPKGICCLVSIACCVLLTGMLGVTGIKVLLESNLKPNIQKLRNPGYSAFSFRDYYAIGVLEQVEAYLYENTGATQEEYRVVSLGMDPAAALYHGFYCLDGYSNNYPLAYKHRFREIIAPELAKSEYLQDSFDDWGNRCYLFSAECPGYYTIEKNGFSFASYTLDVESLKELGGDYPTYLLSAAYIQNAEETGLVLLLEEPFETEDSYYRIFLYGLE